MPKRPIIDISIIAAVALLVRIIYVVQLSGTPFFETPLWFDTAYHDAWARQITGLEIEQHGISAIERYHDVWAQSMLGMNQGVDGVYFRAPGYPFFLAFIYSLTGGDYFIPRLVQAFLGAITAVLTYLLAVSLTGKRAIGLMAGIGVALYGMLVYFDGELLIETLFIPLFLAALLTYHKFRFSQKFWYLLIPGLLLGLAVITRPNALVLLPIFILDQIFAERPSEMDLTPAKKCITAALVFIGCSIPVLPVTLHNAIQGGDSVLIASQGGVNFYIGNNPYADGWHSYIPGLGPNWDVPSASRIAYQTEGRLLKPSGVSDYYYKLGRHFITTQPFAWLKLMFRKFYTFWNHMEIGNNRDLYFFKSETWILPILRVVGFWLIGPLGLFGFWIAWREKLLPRWFLWMIPLYMLGVMMFFVTSRFRTPLIPALSILSVLSVFYFLERRNAVFRKENLTALGILAVLAIFVNSNLYSFKVDEAHSHFSLASVHMMRDDYEAAEAEYRAVLRDDSTYHSAHLNLGMIAYHRGDMETAEREYLEEVRFNPQNGMAYNNLGALYFEAGQLEEAKQYYEQAYQLQPFFSGTAVNLAECLFSIGLEEAKAEETQSAAEHFARACQLDPNKAHYWFNYGLSLGRMGQQQQGLQQIQRALQIDPNYEPARRLLARLSQGGR